MRFRILCVLMLLSFAAAAQPTNYTRIANRYRWISGMFDSALYVPRYNGTPSGVRVNETSVFDGMVAMDTTNNRLYIYSGGAWVRLANYSEIAAYTAGNGLTLSGSQFELGGALSKPTSITGNYKLFLNNRHTHIQGDTVYFASNTNNLINLNSSGGLGDELLLEANGGAIRFTSVSDLYMPAPIFTGTVSSGASTDSILTVNTLTGQVRKRQLSEVVTTPTLQQVLEAGSEATVSSEIIIESLTTTVSLASSQEVSLAVTGKSSLGIIDSITIKPHLGVVNIDSLRTWSGISDTTHKKPMTWDTRNGRWEYAANWPQQKINLVFGAGSGADSDTTAFTTSAIYGSFYNDADTIVVTSMRSVLQGTSPDVTYKVWYNDSLNVEAGATALNTSGNQVTSTTTGTNVTSFDVTKIPPGVWVWVKTSTVATKPKYFSLTLNGYRK